MPRRPALQTWLESGENLTGSGPQRPAVLDRPRRGRPFPSFAVEEDHT
jgi:hypothetical protein